METPIKILYVYGDTLRLGGIECYMINNFRYMDRSVVQIDFLLQGNGKSVFEREITDAGSKVYHLEKPSKNIFRYMWDMFRIFKHGDYKIVHGHCDAMNCRIMRLAKLCGIPVRIAHSHNTEHVLDSKTRYLFYELCRRHVGRYATDLWACSRAAGEWMFQKRPFEIIPNAINLDQFAFDPERRQALRSYYGIGEEEIVIGHVGRFHVQKNHEFIVRLFSRLAGSKRKYRLVFVGMGKLQEEIQTKVIASGLQDKVIFTGIAKNPYDYYNMMDLFVLPSRFEGYPLVVTEATANGLRCIVSENVTREVSVEDQVRFCPLNLDAWQKAIEETDTFERRDARPQLREKGMDIYSTAKQTQERYVRLYSEAVK